MPSRYRSCARDAVLGSAAIAAFMQSRLEANLPGASDAGGFGDAPLPDFVIEGFSSAMAQAMLLPAGTILIGVVAVLFLRRPATSSAADWHAQKAEDAIGSAPVAKTATDAAPAASATI
ncbi:hypothetical protein [Microbacterium sp. NPDC064584]|uniref:hypothetical protein n=1 Tax=Microbacterium sp. NPDC064584 TaxID=3155817 RepID=UPI00342C1CBC